MESLGLTAGAIILLLIGIIGFFLKYVLASKDKKIESLTESFNHLENDLIKMKADLQILDREVSDNRQQLATALNSVNKLLEVNSRIERQLDKSNSIHQDMKTLLEKIMTSKFV